jgi:hypothetical protein
MSTTTHIICKERWALIVVDGVRKKGGKHTHTLT